MSSVLEIDCIISLNLLSAIISVLCVSAIFNICVLILTQSIVAVEYVSLIFVRYVRDLLNDAITSCSSLLVKSIFLALLR